MQITQAELDRYRDRLAERQEAARAYLLARLSAEARGLGVAAARDAAIAIMRDCLAVFGDQAQALSAGLFDEICEAEGIDAEPGRMFDGLIDAGRLSEKVRYYAGKLAAGDWDGYAGSNADLAAYYVHREALANMERNCDMNEVRYARVGTGRETCGWCFMLSSRGFDYGSEKTAEAASHPHCDCIIVPGKKGVTEIAGYEPEAMRDRWTGIYTAENCNLSKAIRHADKEDPVWLYRGVKLRGRSEITGPMDGEDARKYVGTLTQSKKVVKAKQDRHRHPGNGRSTVALSDEEIEGLVAKLAGRRENRIYVNNHPDGTPQIKERITVQDSIIGEWVSEDRAQRQPTDTFIVHYSDNGIHVVPARRADGGQKQ